MSSPFSDRSMITDPAHFFGRTAESRKIFNALAAALLAEWLRQQAKN